jgi:hypothetical protein
VRGAFAIGPAKHFVGVHVSDLSPSPAQVELLVDFLTGNLGASPEQQLASKVVQLVIAGGSLGQLEVLAAPNPYSRQQTTAMEPVRWEGAED